MRKKIAILTYSLGGGGAERTVANLLNHLDKDKYDIRLVLMNTDIDYDIPKNQVIHYIEKSDRYEGYFNKLIKLPMLAYRFAKYCKEEKIELVLAVMNRPNMVATMAKWFGLKAKVLISEQFYTPYMYNNSTFGGRIKTWLLKTCYRKADCILPNSKGTQEALEHHFQISTDYSVIKNPTDIQRITAMKDDPVHEEVDLTKFTFINVAAYRAEKNHDLLIDAVAKLRHRDFQLLFMGKGPLLNQIKQKVYSLGLDKKIIFIPFADNPFKYLSRCKCFVLSSFGEGFPNILIESMICGLPIISVDCKTGPRELLASGTDMNTVIPTNEFEVAEYGILCAPDSLSSIVAAMSWVLDHPQNLQQYKEKGVKKGNEFDVQNVSDEISATIDKYL